MKRFTETDKWQDAWFRKLPPLTKLVYLFILDSCDVAGFFQIDIEAIAFLCKLPDDKIRGLFEGLNSSQDGLSKVLIRRGEYVWLKDFVADQKNLPLNPLNNAHRKIISCINARSDFEEAQLLLSHAEEDQRARVSQKEAVWVRDRGGCQYCHKEIEVLSDYELDHIVPRASHVSEVYTNFATACMHCNRTKRDKPVDLTVSDYSSAQAKQELRNNPTLLLRFNAFFSRNLRILNESLTELAPELAPPAPPVRGTGRVEVKVKKEESAERNHIPSLDEVRAYAKEIEMPPDEADGWFDHFESNGWKVSGKTAMKDWRAGLRNGMRRTGKQPSNGHAKPQGIPPDFKTWFDATHPGKIIPGGTWPDVPDYLKSDWRKAQKL